MKTIDASEPLSTDAGLGTPLTAAQLLVKATGLALVFVVILLFLTALAVGVFAYSQLNTFLQASNLNFSEFKSLVSEGLSVEPKKTNNKTTVLILGLDTVENKQDAPPLTDTMILLSIDYASGKIHAVSLPRDLWSTDYKTKINALYYYGLERDPEHAYFFPTQVVGEMTNLPIDYTVVFTLSSISELVDILGGLPLQVPTSFVDNEFPREDINLSDATSSADLYETVSFTAGIELMSADRVTKYMRSRHSEGDTGTDTDRAARQQLVISTLLKELTSRKVLTDPSKMAQLYNWYQKHMNRYLATPEAIAIAHSLYPYRNDLKLETDSLSISTATRSGVLTHPPLVQTDNQWTYTITNQQLFEQEIYDKLGY